MQHRNTYQPPNTPSFTIDSTTDQIDSPSPQSRTHSHSHSHFQTLPQSRSNSIMTIKGEGGGDYFDTPYPPTTSMNDSSSVHLPLLNHHHHSSPPSSPSPPSPTTTTNTSTTTSSRRNNHRTKSFSSITSLTSTRTRLHPLVLIPVFVLGVMFSMSLSSGSGGGNREYDKMGRSAMSSLKVHTPSSLSLENSSKSPNYTLHSSGHLFLSPESILHHHQPQQHEEFNSLRHPIHELILNASLTWSLKISKQSQNLTAAVQEYKRRFNNRNPPKGFDKWFKFAKENKVILLDEFDQTFKDVELFWSLPPKVIRERAEKLQKDPSTFTMLINGENADEEVEIVGAHAKDGRAKDQKELMKRWSKFIKGSPKKDGSKGFEGVNITMAAHDGPSIMMDIKSRDRHLNAARTGKLLKEEEYEQVDEDAALWGFPLACPVNSRLRRAYDGLEIDNLPKGPSFVADHVQTMNLCENPEWQYLHGFTSWPGMRPQILRPLFSFAKTSLHSDILLTPLEQFRDQEPWDPKWEDKPHNKAVWRGSTTGVWFDRGTWWRSSQRVRLWFMGKDETGSKNVRFSTEGIETPIGVQGLSEKRVPTKELMDRYVDFAFTGREGQCSVEDGSCEAVKKLFDFQRTFGWNEANEYKYMLDLDGNAWSGRFHRLLSTNSAVLKSTIFPEWYAGWIQPWVHYIPIKVDYTDLFDVMAFFSGDLDGQNHHEHLAKQIADNGKDYTERFWRYQDMEAYFFRLTLEWARVSADDRESMDYIHPGL
ncbi:hypothetical protein JCM3765_000559 [Sporobolomyces pararoseus]